MELRAGQRTNVNYIWKIDQVSSFELLVRSELSDL